MNISLPAFHHAFYTLSLRKPEQQDSIIRIGEVQFGGGRFVAIVSTESESRLEMEQDAAAIRRSGAQIIAGHWKEQNEGIPFRKMSTLQRVANQYGLLTMLEVTAHEQLKICEEYADLIAIDIRLLRNQLLLRRLSSVKRPIVLKRSHQDSYEDLLGAAEYLLSHGNPNIILCEGSICPFENIQYNSLDIAAIPELRQLTHLPVIAYPVHCISNGNTLSSITKACVAAGADGLFLELKSNITEDYANTRSINTQALSSEEYAALMHDVRMLALVCGRRMSRMKN